MRFEISEVIKNEYFYYLRFLLLVHSIQAAAFTTLLVIDKVSIRWDKSDDPRILYVVFFSIKTMVKN